MEFVNEKTGRPKEIPVKPGQLMAVFAKRIDKKKLESAEGIILVSGPGPFSSIRAGVLIANLTSRIFKLPLYEVRSPLAKTFSEITSDIHGGRLKPSDYVSPIYDAEANITMPKKI